MSINKSKLTKSIHDRGNYTTLPNDIWSSSVSTQAKIIYIYLLSNSEQWSPGHREIHNNTGVRRQKIASYLKELEDSGMLIITCPPKSGMRARYEFTSLSSWKKEAEKEVKVDVIDVTSVPALTLDNNTNQTQLSILDGIGA